MAEPFRRIAVSKRTVRAPARCPQSNLLIGTGRATDPAGYPMRRKNERVETMLTAAASTVLQSCRANLPSSRGMKTMTISVHGLADRPVTGAKKRIRWHGACCVRFAFAARFPACSRSGVQHRAHGIPGQQHRSTFIRRLQREHAHKRKAVVPKHDKRAGVHDPQIAKRAHPCS